MKVITLLLCAWLLYGSGVLVGRKQIEYGIEEYMLEAGITKVNKFGKIYLSDTTCLGKYLWREFKDETK